MVAILIYVDDKQMKYPSVQDVFGDVCKDKDIAIPSYESEYVYLTKPDIEEVALRMKSMPDLSREEKKRFYRQALTDKIDERLAYYQLLSKGNPDLDLHIVLVFDNSMELPPGTAYLGEYIQQLWTRKDDWMRRTPIIVSAVDPTRKPLNELPAREGSSVFGSYNRFGADGLPIRAALRRALVWLLQHGRR